MNRENYGVDYVGFENKLAISIPKICYEIIIHRDKENLRINLPEYNFNKGCSTITYKLPNPNTITMSNLEQKPYNMPSIKHNGEEWIRKVDHDNLLNLSIKEILEGVKQDIEKVNVSGGGSGRRLKEQFINHLEEVTKKL